METFILIIILGMKQWDVEFFSERACISASSIIRADLHRDGLLAKVYCFRSGRTLKDRIKS